MKSFVFVLALLAAVAFAVDNSAWFVLICGSDGWDDYATEASFYKLYHVLHDLGIPDSRIVTFFSDKIAYDERNPYPGEVYNANYHEGGPNENVYEGMLKDYTGSDASSRNLLNVLNGLPTTGGSGKVLHSTENDNVFIYYVGPPVSLNYYNHWYASLPTYHTLYKEDIRDALKNMTTNKQYNKLMLYVESGHSGHLIDISHKSDKNVYLVSSQYASDPSWKSNYDPFIHNYVSRDDIGNFTAYLEEHGLDFTIEDFYADGLHTHTLCQWGDSLMKNMTFRDFVWNKDFKYHTKPVYMHNHPPFNVPGVPFCTEDEVCTTKCDCYAICKIRGYTDERCSNLCCEPSGSGCPWQG